MTTVLPGALYHVVTTEVGWTAACPIGSTSDGSRRADAKSNPNLMVSARLKCFCHRWINEVEREVERLAGPSHRALDFSPRITGLREEWNRVHDVVWPHDCCVVDVDPQRVDDAMIVVRKRGL